MKLGDIVEFKMVGTLLDTGYVSKYDEDPAMIWVTYAKMGPQRIHKDSAVNEVISEAR